MEAKWGAIAAIGVFGVMFAAMAVTSVAQNKRKSACLASYAMTERSAEEIKQICK